MRFSNSLTYFVPKGFLDIYSWEFRKRRIFASVCLITALYAILFLPQCVYMNYYGAVEVITLFTVINLILPFLLKAGVPLAILVNVYILTMALAEFRIMYISGGVHHTATDPQILVVCALMGLFFLGYRWAFIWFFVATGIIVWFGIQEANGIPFEYDMDEEFILFQTIAASAGHLIIVFMIVNMFQREKNLAITKLNERNLLLELEKKRSDDLLLNILPEEVMEELKDTGKTSAKNYDLVTVLFADIKDFTIISESLTPEELVSGIDEYFETFDRILEKYDVEKIKTIGDAYVCVSGLPNFNDDNPCIMVEMALELANAVDELKDKRKNLGLVPFEVRFGLHSGPVVAGVVGVKKFAYDIWGDTV
ncbi:MAG: hypothetical protein KDC11_12180, partial [Chitinophagaceae bacterium]|nr:hypothetical protein [Chitinophagaceae bacterium]